MSIESTYMKIGKEPKGVIGETTQEKAVKIWALSHHLCGELMAELEGLRETESKVDCAKHKEEYEGKMKTDNADQLKTQDALVTTFTHPLKPEMHAENILVNTYSGEGARSNVNVNNLLETESKGMIRFQESLPDGFSKTL